MENSTQIGNMFSGTVEALSALAARSTPRERAELRRAIQTLRWAQPRAERQPIPPVVAESAPLLASGIVAPDSLDNVALTAWGTDLMQRRKAAGFSRQILAERAGISDSTLRDVEKGRRAPTRTTIMHLQSVPELRIETGPPKYAAGRDAKEARFAPNCWLAPEFDAIKLHNDMKLQFSGRGGHIEQTYLYLDPNSATAWCAFAEQESYTRRRMGMPLGQVAERILEQVGTVGLDVIGLGCGDGRDEVRLTQCLLEQSPERNLRLYLLDISQPLCCAAYRYAAHALGHHNNASVYAIQGNFYNLQRYSQLLATPQRAHRRRIVCMFGNTFGNIDNEVMFVRNSLVGFAPGDMLLLSLAETMAPPDEPEQILRKDPRLSHKVPKSAGLSHHDQQLVGVVNSYVEGTRSVELSSVLDLTSCVVPGSYAADVRATVKLASGDTKQFSLYTMKRYDRTQLDQTMASEGWEPVTHWRYDMEYHPLMLLLYRRVRRTTDPE
jgi:transcriptional regulator with XRE-family HTH domain